MSQLALWLLVVALGTQTAAGLFETRVLVPLWAHSPPASVLAFRAATIRPDSGRRFWVFLTPVTGLISLANLVVAWRAPAPLRTWWLGSAGTALLVIAVTFAYFVPVLLRVLGPANMDPATLTKMVRWWVRLNWLRFVILLVAWLAALKAFQYGA